jgi:hypothetical protein
VERKRLTHKEFGALIHRNEKTVPDIFDRASMLQKELTLTQELVKYLKETIAFAKEQIEIYKIKLAGVSTV